jgi:DNA-binding CsgD family transcriptional regulator
MDRQCIGPVQSSLAELALLGGRPAEALDAMSTGIELLSHGSARTLVPLYAIGLRACADLAVLARVRRSEETLAATARDGAGFHAAVRAFQADRGSAGRWLDPVSSAWATLAEAEWSRLDGEADPDLWAASASTWEELGQPYPAAYARYREAEALLAARADRARASDALARVMAFASSLDARPLHESAAALARHARISIDEPTSDQDAPLTVAEAAAPMGLTAREVEVLVLVAEGRTNQQIADALFISPKTASVHVSNILGKLGVNGRVEAALIARQIGIV